MKSISYKHCTIQWNLEEAKKFRRNVSLVKKHVHILMIGLFPSPPKFKIFQPKQFCWTVYCATLFHAYQKLMTQRQIYHHLTYQSYPILHYSLHHSKFIQLFYQCFWTPIKYVSLAALRLLTAWPGSELDNDNRVITCYQSTPSLPWLITIWRHVPVNL